MSILKHTKQMYNTYGKEYMKTRYNKEPERVYNEFYELPAMVKAVGKIKNKKLLDIGCGSGEHIKKYLKKGAKCFGIDISKTMIDIAKKNCKNADFKVGSMTKLPYKANQFDVIAASLCLDYINNLNQVFKEVHRVLKKGGLFYYSYESPIAGARTLYKTKKYTIKGIGKFIDKATGTVINVGNAWTDNKAEWDMVPGMKMKTYTKTFRSQLKALVKNNLELIDFIDIKPNQSFKKINPKAYKTYSKFPLFSIYVAKKS